MIDHMKAFLQRIGVEMFLEREYPQYMRNMTSTYYGHELTIYLDPEDDILTTQNLIKELKMRLTDPTQLSTYYLQNKTPVIQIKL